MEMFRTLAINYFLEKMKSEIRKGREFHARVWAGHLATQGLELIGRKHNKGGRK